MKIGSIYVPLLFIVVAFIGALIVVLTFAGALAGLPLWIASSLCGAGLMTVAFLVHYVMSARKLSKVVWGNLPEFKGSFDTIEDVSKVANPTADPLQLPRQITLFIMCGGGAFFGLLFTLTWLRWLVVAVAIVGAIVYAAYDFLPDITPEARATRAELKKEKEKAKQIAKK